MNVFSYIFGMAFNSLVSSILLWLTICYLNEKKYFWFSVHAVLTLSIILQMAKIIFYA